MMIRTFRHRGLKRLHGKGDPSKLRADQAERVAVALADLHAAKSPQDLDLPGCRLHPLKGGPEVLLEHLDLRQLAHYLPLEGGDAYDVELVDYH